MEVVNNLITILVLAIFSKITNQIPISNETTDDINRQSNDIMDIVFTPGESLNSGSYAKIKTLEPIPAFSKLNESQPNNVFHFTYYLAHTTLVKEFTFLVIWIYVILTKNYNIINFTKEKN
jgi:hypothetical protein